ncbi:hypothetical protein EV646_106216 [Kribbella antiqua]|uniref:Uncharacterized protein n=1 Tax=Kribbella antiqua TaxID=2512217 RepID=A0A4R2IQ09_9ACTN|nr:hypothetical protein EV646_106216 [Kribbella antiqua]
MADQPSPGPREAAAAGAVGSRAWLVSGINQTELWPDAGHGLPTELPDQFNARLLKFVD